MKLVNSLPITIGTYVQQPEGFKAFIPASFPPEEIRTSDPIAKKHAEAIHLVGKLDGITKLLPDRDYFLCMFIANRNIFTGNISIYSMRIVSNKNQLVQQGGEYYMIDYKNLSGKSNVLKYQIAQQDPKNTEWAELGKDSFDFGLLASRGFKKDKSEAKKIIFKTVGSNPILLDQKLQFQLR